MSGPNVVLDSACHTALKGQRSTATVRYMHSADTLMCVLHMKMDMIESTMPPDNGSICGFGDTNAECLKIVKSRNEILP